MERFEEVEELEEFETGLDACPNCGAKIEAVLECENCGAILASADEFSNFEEDDVNDGY